MKLDDYIQAQISKSRSAAGLVLVSVEPAVVANISQLGPDYRGIPMQDARASMSRTRSVAVVNRTWKVVAIRATNHLDALDIEADIVVRVTVKANELVAITTKNRDPVNFDKPVNTPVTL